MVNAVIRRTLGDLTHPIFIKQMVWVALFWALTVITILLNIEFLNTQYPNAAKPNDLILDLIPETEAFITVGEVLSALQIVLVVYVMWTWRFKPAPKLLFLMGLMFMIRGFAINLTPLGQIQPPSENYPDGHFIARTFYYGMFFSGHTASAFIQAFFIKGHRLRPLVFVLASVQAFALLASHSHYSIDVFGGFFVAYFVTHYDFMRLVPNRLLHVKWMPWYTGEPLDAADEPTAELALAPAAAEISERDMLEAVH